MADYVLTGSKWGDTKLGSPAGQITWSFAQNPGDFTEFDQYITDPEYQALARAAFDAWERVAGIDFVEVADSSSVDVRLGWRAIDGVSGTLGLAGTIEYPSVDDSGSLGTITEAEIIFDLAEDWLTGKVANFQQPTFYLTALHEIGHVLGLDHTSNPDTIMYVSQSGLSELTAGDIAGVRALYGTFLATEGADSILGTSQADVIPALAGADRLEGGGGNDVLDGGVGIDTAVYSGNQSSYTLTLSPTSTSITDRRADGNGTDQLIDIELLDFDTEIPALGGQPLNLAMFGGPTELSEENFTNLIELYIAYFNRAPDALGLNFWATNYSKGQPLEEIATLFLDQDETRALYPEGTPNYAFLEDVYTNVLGRLPDADGFNFWLNNLNSGDLGRDEFIFNFLGGAQGSDISFLKNKVMIGTYFAVTKGMSDGVNGAAVMDLFDGTEASINAAVAAIDGYYADALDPAGGEFLMPLVGVLNDPFAAA